MITSRLPLSHFWGRMVPESHDDLGSLIPESELILRLNFPDHDRWSPNALEGSGQILEWEEEKVKDQGGESGCGFWMMVEVRLYWVGILLPLMEGKITSAWVEETERSIPAAPDSHSESEKQHVCCIWHFLPPCSFWFLSSGKPSHLSLKSIGY